MPEDFHPVPRATPGREIILDDTPRTPWTRARRFRARTPLEPEESRGCPEDTLNRAGFSGELVT